MGEMEMVKGLLAVALVLALGFGIAGCGNDDTPTVPPIDAPDVPDVPDVPEVPEVPE